MEPDFIDAYNNLGLTFYEEEKYDSAFLYLQKSLSKLPTGTTALINTGLVEEKRGHLDEALAYYKKVVANDPDNPEGHYNVARVLVTAGRLQESIPVAEQAEKLYTIQKSPVIGECHLLQLIIYFNLKNKVMTKKYQDLCKKDGMDVPADLQGDPN
jgi:tetratricopeptide (TPR) repeat protein